MAISFQLLFIIISGVIFIYLREKSFKYYALYNLCLLLYLLTRNDDFYYGFEGAIAYFVGPHQADIFVQIVNFLIQVIFYNFYSIFALYFLDLDKHVKKYFNTVVLVLKILGLLFIVFAVICYLMQIPDFYITLYTFVYLPVMLTIFIVTVFKAVRYSGRHKDFFLVGVCFYVMCALIAFAGTFIPSLNMTNPITFFYVGIIIETIFFSLGLAYKIKLINDEKNRINNLVIQHRHQQQIGKMQGLLEGEEKERKRIAEELHDGIAGDLSAIKFNLTLLNKENETDENTSVLNEVSTIIDKSCQQLREISHNLSSSTITNLGLLGAVDLFCKKVEALYKIKINFSSKGDEVFITKTIETHIYRIIQELVNNVVKHSEAKYADVKIDFVFPHIHILVQDNGKGFSADSVSKGIGLSNIDSRLRFMNAILEKNSSEKGTVFHITINLNEIPETP